MNFDNLPSELLRHIFFFVPLEDYIQHGVLTCKRFYSVTDDAFGQLVYYRKMYQQQFPHHFAEIPLEEDKKISRGEIGVNWAHMLRAAYYSNYKKLQPVYVKRIFSLVKANDAETLRAHSRNKSELLLDYNLLDKKDSYDVSLAEWAQGMSQSVMDSFYQVAEDYFGGQNLQVTKTDGPIHHRTILYWAFWFYQGISRIQGLLALGSSLEECYERWRIKPFHFAIRLGRLDLVKYLVETYPYLLEQTEDNGNTPLMVAAEAGLPEVVVFLLSKKANLMRTRKDGKHALNIAVENGHILTTIEILKASVNAKPYVPDQPVLGPRFHPEAPPSADALPIEGQLALEVARAQAGLQPVRPLLVVTACGALGVQAIHIAAQYGDVEMMQTLVDHNPFPHINLLEQVDIGGHTPLMWAAINEHKEAVAFCIRHKVNLDARSINSARTAFNYAVEKNNTEISMQLLIAGADVKHRISGRLPIHVAARNKNKRLVTALLIKYPELRTENDRHNLSLLRIAFLNADYDMAFRLLKFGVKLSSGGTEDELVNHAGKLLDKIAHQKNLGRFFVELFRVNPFLLNVHIEGYTVLQRAVKAKNLEMMKIIFLNHPNLDERFKATNGHSDQNKTALYMAVEEQFEEGVRLLLLMGASVNLPIGEKRKNCIHLAAKKGHAGILKALIEKYCDLINSPDSQGRTPLHIAVAANQIDAVKCLVKHRAALNTCLSETKNWVANFTPLRLAIKLRHDSIAALLIRSGASMTHLAGKHKHPIHTAVTEDRILLLDALIERDNFMLQLQDELGRTPLALAVLQRKLPLVKYLLNADKTLIQKVGGCYNLHLAIQSGSLEAVKMIIADCPSWLASEDDFGRSPLVAAVLAGNLPIVEYLLEIGVKINGVSQAIGSNKGKSALQIAAERGDNKMCHVLLKHGALGNLKNPLFTVQEPLNKAKLNKSTCAEVEMLAYETERSKQGTYKVYLRFFGKKIGFGCVKERKLQALAALKQYRFFGADKSTLKEYRRELNNGKLKIIRRNLGIRNI
jgi:ankyrin repeat protein